MVIEVKWWKPLGGRPQQEGLLAGSVTFVKDRVVVLKGMGVFLRVIVSRKPAPLGGERVRGKM
jgi:hypothetical protein